MADVAMPRLSDSMEEGTILKWLKSDGDEVSRGEELVEIETDKANMTYEADQEGVLKIVAQEGDTLPVGGTTVGAGRGRRPGTWWVSSVRGPRPVRPSSASGTPAIGRRTGSGRQACRRSRANAAAEPRR